MKERGRSASGPPRERLGYHETSPRRYVAPPRKAWAPRGPRDRVPPGQLTAPTRASYREQSPRERSPRNSPDILALTTHFRPLLSGLQIPAQPPPCILPSSPLLALSAPPPLQLHFSPFAPLGAQPPQPFPLHGPFPGFIKPQGHGTRPPM